MASGQPNTVSPTRVIAALNQMGYHEVERFGDVSILDHQVPSMMPYPIAIDCGYDEIPLADLEAHLEDAGIDLNVFHECLNSVQ